MKTFLPTYINPKMDVTIGKRIQSRDHNNDE